MISGKRRENSLLRSENFESVPFFRFDIVGGQSSVSNFPDESLFSCDYDMKYGESLAEAGK